MPTSAYAIQRFALLALCLAWPVRADFVAFDCADNDPYPLGFSTGQNGGYGFTGWELLDEGDPGTMFIANKPLDDGAIYSWGMSGSYALGRGLGNSQNSFTWSFLASHESDAGFSGFNLKTSTSIGFATDEVLRFGLDLGTAATGFFVSTNRGVGYAFQECGWVDASGDTLLYSITWNNGSFSVGVSNVTEDLSSTAFSGTLGAQDDIAMFGVALDGNTLDETLHFDRFEVVPEPGAALLLVVGLLVVMIVRFRP